jgi:hypothetical protein
MERWLRRKADALHLKVMKVRSGRTKGSYLVLDASGRPVGSATDVEGLRTWLADRWDLDRKR